MTVKLVGLDSTAKRNNERKLTINRYQGQGVNLNFN